MQISFLHIVLVALGGMVGSVARFVTGKLVQNHVAGNFPWGTFAVNVTGSLLMGVFLGLAAKQQNPENWRLLLATGFCGGFTTFSAMSNEGFHLLKQQQYTIFAIYFAASLVLGLAAVAGGYFISKYL